MPQTSLFLAIRMLFLFAVIFDQGIQAERAWAAPYFLMKRLGHFEMADIAKMEVSELTEVIARPPALHRYVNNVSKWLKSAAQKIVFEFDGDAINIWNDSPTAFDFIGRLQAFKGIGQKKAAMATQILIRDLKVPVRKLSGTQVAYDVHIRRVFLRSGLIAEDDPEQIILVARTFSPDDPSKLDLPAWYVGRNWCHPRSPDCGTCPLGNSCIKNIRLGKNLDY